MTETVWNVFHWSSEYCLPFVCRGILVVWSGHRDLQALRVSLESLVVDIWWVWLSLDSDFHLTVLVSMPKVTEHKVKTFSIKQKNNKEINAYMRHSVFKFTKQVLCKQLQQEQIAEGKLASPAVSLPWHYGDAMPLSNPPLDKSSTG